MMILIVVKRHSSATSQKDERKALVINYTFPKLRNNSILFLYAVVVVDAVVFLGLKR